jgi:hypothetical protein
MPDGTRQATDTEKEFIGFEEKVKQLRKIDNKSIRFIRHVKNNETLLASLNEMLTLMLNRPDPSKGTSCYSHDELSQRVQTQGRLPWGEINCEKQNVH